jgi:hypothetical protein
MRQWFAIRHHARHLITVTCLTATLLVTSHTSANGKASTASAPAPQQPTTSPTTAATAGESKFRVGRIAAPAISESSGLVASRKHAGVFWAHNDSGNPPSLFAVTREGELIREFAVDAKNVDWEDLAIDDAGRLYIADVGNNTRKRTEVQVYRVDEPADPRAPAKGAARSAPLRVNRTWRLTYPGDKPFDCESLFVWLGKGYVFPKRLSTAPAELFSFDLDSPARVQRLTKVADVPPVRAPVTAADVSADGKQLAVLTVFGPYIFDINGDVASIGKARVRHSRYVDPKMEAACFVPEGLLVTNEDRDVFLFRYEHFTEVK